MATQPLIDRDTASKIITILDFVYSLGVEDCHYKQDEGLAREFLEKTSEQGRYGLLGKEIFFDWFEWELQLKRAAREAKYPFSSIMQYFGRMGAWQSNWLSVLIPVSFDFYRKGISDRLNAPDGCEYAMFAERRRVWWSKHGIQKVSLQEYVDVIQQFCLDRRRMDIAEMERYEDKRENKYERIGEWDMRKRVLNPRFYERYIKAIAVLISKKDY